MLKYIYDVGANMKMDPPPPVHVTTRLSGKMLQLTHVNNMGSKIRKLVADGLRCKVGVTEAIRAVNPVVENIKVLLHALRRHLY